MAPRVVASVAAVRPTMVECRKVSWKLPRMPAAMSCHACSDGWKSMNGK